jgi:prefoldin subunit 5
MRDQLEARLAQLKQDFETGQSQLQELDEQRASLTQTMLRISGAIQVLEEMLAAAPADESAQTQA